MGRTVPSFTIALEEEVSGWRLFRRALGDKSRKELDRLFDLARNHRSASSAAVRTRKFEAMLMAMIFAHEKMLADLASELERLRMKGEDYP